MTKGLTDYTRETLDYLLENMPVWDYDKTIALEAKAREYLDTQRALTEREKDIVIKDAIQLFINL